MEYQEPSLTAVGDAFAVIQFGTNGSKLAVPMDNVSGQNQSCQGCDEDE